MLFLRCSPPVVLLVLPHLCNPVAVHIQFVALSRPLQTFAAVSMCRNFPCRAQRCIKPIRTAHQGSHEARRGVYLASFKASAGAARQESQAFEFLTHTQRCGIVGHLQAIGLMLGLRLRTCRSGSVAALISCILARKRGPWSPSLLCCPFVKTYAWIISCSSTSCPACNESAAGQACDLHT